MSESPFDKKVRAIFPKDHHIVLASLAGWAGLYVLASIPSMFSSKKKKAPAVEAAAPTPAPAASAGGFAFPTADNLGEWAEKESNWAELEKHLK